MWMVFIGGTWQPAANDAVVFEWIRTGAVQAGTMVRHVSWAQAARVADVPNFRPAFAGRGAAHGHKPDFALQLVIGCAVLFAELVVFVGLALAASSSLVASIAIVIIALASGGALAAGHFASGAPRPMRSISARAKTHPVIAASALATILLGGATATYAQRRNAALCNQALARFGDLKSETLPYDAAIQRFDTLGHAADDGADNCQSAGMSDAAERLHKARGVIQLQEWDAKQKAAKEQTQQAAAAKKRQKDEEARNFPNEVKSIAQSIAAGQAALAKHDYSTASARLADARASLDAVKGTPAEASKDWTDLDARLTKQEAALQPHLDLLRDEAKARGDKPQPSAWDGSYYPVDKYLKAHLKDPDSYDLQSCSDEPRADGPYWQVRCTYRANNSFGAKVLESHVFFIQQGRVVKVAD